MLGLGSSTNGTFITTNVESFAYVIRDLRGDRTGDTIRTATNRFTVSTTNAVSAAQSITTGGGGVAIRFAGVPGYA